MSFRSFFALLLAFVFSAFASAQSDPPSWTYASYFGGSDSDSITAQTRDASGNVYVAGITRSINFPTTLGAYEPVYPGPAGDDVIFVSKFNSAGSLIWSTYLGAGCSYFIAAYGIAVDAAENVYVSGIDRCSGWPTTVSPGNSGSVFVAKLDAAGSSLVYSTTLGGNSVLGTPELVVDSSGNAYVIGSGDLCCNSNTGIIGPLGGISDFWVAEIDSSGASIPWAVEIGGSGLDEAYGIALDSANKLYLTGYSDSRDFPTSSGAMVQPGTGRAFIMKLDPAKSPKSSIVYSALAGNPGNNSNDFLEGDSIAVDAYGHAYVGAWTYNHRLYVSPNAFRKSYPTDPNVYVFELNSSGSAIINGTYLGGGGADYIDGVAVDNVGNTYVTGFTESWDFPTTAYGNALAYNSTGAYYVKLNPQFAAISSVAFGPNGTAALTASPDISGGLWLSGYTVAGFPTTPNGYQPNYGGGSDDGFLVHTNFAGLCPTAAVSICTVAEDRSYSERIHIASQSANQEGATSIALNLDGLQVYFVRAAQFDITLPVAPGTHTATVTAHGMNSWMQQTWKSFSVRASSSCPLNPTIPSLTICTPLNAAVVKGTVHINVRAHDSAPPGTLSLRIDGKYLATLRNQNGTYTYSTTLSTGAHSVQVAGSDGNRAWLSTSAFFRVSN